VSRLLFRVYEYVGRHSFNKCSTAVDISNTPTTRISSSRTVIKTYNNDNELTNTV